MKDYWELSERERSALSEDAVALFVAVELMKEGLTKPEPPELDVVDDVEVSTTATWHLKYEGQWGPHATSVGFPTKEAAEKARELGAVYVDSDHAIGRSVTKGIVGIEPRDEAISQEDAARLRDRLAAAETAKRVNANKKRAYDDELSKCEKATSAMWADWNDCREKAREMERVARVFAEYQELAGDKDLARQFLKKAIDSHTLREAEKWNCEDYTSDMPPQCAEAVPA